jgi:catechol 2,3-dioxygenase-like lactoylglutathione lyase family enzyme
MTAPAQAPSLSQIGQIAIPVKDVERAIRFYRDTLGMRFLFQAGPLAFFDCGGVRLMLTVPETAEFDHPASVIYYRVADIEAAHTLLKTRGVAFSGEPHLIHKAPDHDLWMAFFKDSEGNTLALMTEKPRA